MKILKPNSGKDREEIFLPSEITLKILSRVPIKTVFTCKCVCKRWLGLIETPEFARSHLSQSVPGLLIHDATVSNLFKIFELEGSSPELESHELHYKKLLELDIDGIYSLSFYNLGTTINGSANGLLFCRNSKDHYVCNPITREYIKLPEPEGTYDHNNNTEVAYGFGVTVSRLSKSEQYKVVRIFHDCVYDPNSYRYSLLSISMSVWQIYTLGTGSWRAITTPSDMLLDYSCCTNGKLLNGNIHWLARDLTRLWWISCVDLETEVFTKFRAPFVSENSLFDLGVLSGRLCLSENSPVGEISLYLMNDYGDGDKCWNKAYVIRTNPVFFGQSHHVVNAIKAFGDGDVLMASYGLPLFCYSNRTKTVAQVDAFNEDDDHGTLFEASLFTPSFVSLKGFETENAKLLQFDRFEAK